MTFRRRFQLQARNARRQMVRNGELPTLIEFAGRLAIEESQVIRMLATGSLFAIDVDGIAYIPSLLADSVVNQKRLQSIWRILAPAPEDYRLGYLPWNPSHQLFCSF